MRPSRGDHLRKAERNRDFADRLPKSDPTQIGWALTALFYSALHYVEGYLAAFGFYTGNHKVLREEIDGNPQLQALSDDYQELFDYSYNARYRMRNYAPADFSKARAAFSRIEKHIRDLC